MSKNLSLPYGMDDKKDTLHFKKRTKKIRTFVFFLKSNFKEDLGIQTANYTYTS